MHSPITAPSLFFGLLFILLVFSPLSFGSLLWTFETNGPVTVRPVAVGADLLLASQDGNLYFISQNGALIWKRNIGNYILQPVVFGENIIALTTTGHFVELTKGGAIIRDLQLNNSNAGYFYGIAADQNKIYATSNGRLWGINKTGLQYLIYKVQKNITTVLSAPSVAADGTIIFGVDDELFAIKNGLLKWKTKIETVWKSEPVISGNTVYIGTLGNAIYAIDIETGMIRSKREIDGWIIGTPLIAGQTLYVGSTQGYLYAFDTVTGGMLWKKSMGSGISSTPSAGNFGGKEVVFIGTDDSNMYVLNAISGKLLWKWAAGAKAGSPLFHYGKVILPSYDGNVYGLSTDKACLITDPEDGTTIGPKEVMLRGSVLSQGANTVYIRIEGGSWEPTTSEDSESWSFLLDPTPLAGGMNFIECKVGSEETEPSFGYLINYDKSIPLGKLDLEYPSSIEPGKDFVLSVKDAESKAPIQGFTVMYEKKTTKVNGSNVTIKLSQPGKTKITVKKIGFQDADGEIEVKGSELDVVPIALGMLIVLGLLYFYFFIYKRE